VRRSRNELLATVTKASVGAGLPVGTAEEIGQAAVWLADRGVDPVPSVLAGLERPEPDLAAAPRIEQEDGGTVVVGAAMAALAPSALDLLLSQPGEGAVGLRPVDDGVLLLGLVGQALRRSGVTDRTVRIAFDRGASVQVGAATWQKGVAVGAASLAWLSWEQDPVSSETRSVSQASGVEVEAALWDRLTALAARTLVPADPASRASGAGAGDIDNE